MLDRNMHENNQSRPVPLTVLVTVPAVKHNSLHPLPTSSITARHLLDFMIQGKNRGRHTDNPSGCHPIRTIGAPPPSSPIFMPNALTVATLATYPG